MIAVGAELTLPHTGRRLVVRRLLGQGSQGEVFEAASPAGGQPLALKWYFPHTGTRHQRETIVDLIERGSPSDRFLWPEEVVDLPARPSFGYTMPLRPERFASLVDLLTGKVDVPFSVVGRLCLELADNFLQLHSQGLCYRDISFGNVFFDPTSGVPLICDNDNVGVDGGGPSGVLGTRRFMAPEIVRGESTPSTETDLYSLSVLLFYVLMMGHPLVGRRELDFECWDEQAESLLFGHQPLFIFDPDDDANAPLPDLHRTVLQYWELYPGFLRDLFRRAFTAGVRDPRNGRVRESVWRAAMARLIDMIVRCEGCGKQNFVDPARPAIVTDPYAIGFDPTAGPRACWNCRRPVPDPRWLVFDRQPLAISVGTVVHRHHLLRDYDFDHPVGEVAAHPVRADLVGLRNRSGGPWQATLPDGSTRTVEDERTVRLEPGTTVDFGGHRATVQDQLG